MNTNTVLDLEAEFDKYLSRVNLKKEFLPTTQLVELKRAFYGGMGQLFIINDSIDQYPKDYKSKILNEIGEQIAGFWENETGAKNQPPEGKENVVYRHCNLYFKDGSRFNKWIYRKDILDSFYSLGAEANEYSLMEHQNRLRQWCEINGYVLEKQRAGTSPGVVTKYFIKTN